MTLVVIEVVLVEVVLVEVVLVEMVLVEVVLVEVVLVEVVLVEEDSCRRRQGIGSHVSLSEGGGALAETAVGSATSEFEIEAM